ncbi:MAG: efflux RND transporter permease subunit [Oligoflexia bacterium]|nr:efflux RND transporter permease subunit [Oligoflexia bacterium]
MITSLMKSIYSSPYRVYLLIGIVAALGIYAGLNLPISLYPNTSKPYVYAGVPYGHLTDKEFFKEYGQRIESELKAITIGQLKVENIQADYDQKEVNYSIDFKWGGDPEQAQREVRNVFNSLSGNWPKEIRDGQWVNSGHRNSGFLAISFFSSQKKTDEVYGILSSALVPKLREIKGGENIILWNPSDRKIELQLQLESMALMGIFPRNIKDAIESALSTYSGGTIKEGEQSFALEMPRLLNSVQDLEELLIASPKGKLIPLKQLARINVTENNDSNQIFKTNGNKSLILFATPPNGGNVKELSEEIIATVEKNLKKLPSDINYRILVDPSFFIRSAINNVLKEVCLAAFLAVLVLMLFIGNWRNTITAAIEIPLSMVMAFLLMKASNINLNLISLGGLALAAGMNVDASVVVMENIFRHLQNEKKGDLLDTIVLAVKEVMLPVISATISSLVVFIPLALTKDLTYAVLGDLALCVVFSHGISSIVAFIVVPTIRYHLLKSKPSFPKESIKDSNKQGLIEKPLNALSSYYQKILLHLLNNNFLKWSLFSILGVFLIAAPLFIVPQLKKEIIGMPDTDWLVLSISLSHTPSIKHTEGYFDEIEKGLLSDYKDEIRYTFVQINSHGGGSIMLRLKDKEQMNSLWKRLEKQFVNTPEIFYQVIPWNPAELPLPHPPKLRLVVNGGDDEDRFMVAQMINNHLEEKQIFPKLWSTPNLSTRYVWQVKPALERWHLLNSQGRAPFSIGDLLDLTKVITEGQFIGELIFEGQPFNLQMSYSSSFATENIESIPVSVNNKIIPLKGLLPMNKVKATAPLYRENGESIVVINGSEKKGDEINKDRLLKDVEKVIHDFIKNELPGLELKTSPSLYLEDAEKELTSALNQLMVAVAISIAIVFLVLLLQFGDLFHTLIILTAIPLGLIGVLLSLFVFKSTISLNSALGVILLNGIAVGNSILLVDLFRRLLASGLDSKQAAIEASTKRLRPILITSLTTILGMLPIALGIGNGGKVLQPLGIAVTGGLWFSMIFTLFIVPILEVSYIDFKRRRSVQTTKVLTSTVLPLFILIPMISLIPLFFPAKTSAVETTLNFEEAVKNILEQHPSLKKEESWHDSAKMNTFASKLNFLPAVSIEQNESKSWLGDGSTESYTSGHLSINAKLNLFRSGGDLAEFKAALADESIKLANTKKVRLDLEAKSIKIMLSLILQNYQLQSLDKLLTIKKKSLEVSEVRYQRGLAPQEELWSVKVDVSNTKTRYTVALATFNQTKAELSALLGHSNISYEWPWKKNLRSKETIDRLMIGAHHSKIEMYLLERPDWQILDATVKRESFKKWSVVASMLPKVDLSYQEKLRSLFKDNSPRDREKVVMLSISIPLLEQGRGIASYFVQKSANLSADFDRTELKQNALSEILAKQEKLRELIEISKEREQTLGLAQKLYETNFARFKEGRISLNDLILEQGRLFDSQNLVHEAWSLVHENYANLCHALGKNIFQCL